MCMENCHYKSIFGYLGLLLNLNEYEQNHYYKYLVF